MKHKIAILSLMIILAGAGWGTGAYSSLTHTSSPRTQQRTSSHSQLPRLTDQQVSVLVGSAVDPAWLKQELAQGKLIYGVVKPGDTVPAGVQNYSFLVTDDQQTNHYLFFKTGKNQVVTIKYADSGSTGLRTRKVRLRQLVRRFYRTKGQQKQVNTAVSELRTE